MSARRTPRIYTRGGDAGETGLVGGHRIAKDDLRIECYGTVDELNSVIGVALATPDDATQASLVRVQNLLFELGAALATIPSAGATTGVDDDDVAWLEREIDEATDAVPPLTAFILPSGGARAAGLHHARTVCRRAERLVVRLHREGGCDAMAVRFLNRLSDALFAWARVAAHAAGYDEVVWKPRRRA